jgi:non-specific serine/threonine protein kinase
MISLFILRRLKTDKAIISDLPKKIETYQYVGLSQPQAALYKSELEKLVDRLKTGDGKNRLAMLLSSIIRFKQICNHPSQFTNDNKYKITDSCKSERLVEICTTIKEKHEKVLVFTQFQELTKPLSLMLETVFERGGLIIDGKTPISKRSAIVDKFNDKNEYVPFMILSLKAGGVGLNLVSANHVIHYDRW